MCSFAMKNFSELLVVSSGIQYLWVRGGEYYDRNFYRPVVFSVVFSSSKYEKEKWKLELYKQKGAERAEKYYKCSIMRCEEDEMVAFGSIHAKVEVCGMLSDPDAMTESLLGRWQVSGEKYMDRHEFDAAGSIDLDILADKDDVGEVLMEGGEYRHPLVCCSCVITLIPPPGINNHLGDLFSTQHAEYGDVTIQAGEEKMFVYKGIIGRSKVLQRAFSSDMKEGREGRYQINDIKPDVVKEMLYYLYTDQAPNIALPDMAYNLLLAAEKYEIPDLKLACERYLKSNLCVDNAVRTLILADQYNADLLKSKTLEFMKENIKGMNGQQEFKEDLQEFPYLLMELLSVFSN